MQTLEYVLSAPGRLGIFISDVENRPNVHNKLRTLFKDCSDILHTRMRDVCKHYDPKCAILFNAFVEPKFTKVLSHVGNLGLENVYVDSGGLQMVTQGHKSTPEMKAEVYKVQTYGDYAFCFDEIPVTVLSATTSPSERLKYFNRVFESDQHEQAALLTGRNVKEQIDTFRRMGAKTKVMAIAQGNNTEDAVMYVNRINSTLTEDDKNFMGGLAMADACMGLGDREQIQVLRAARRIADSCDPWVLRQLHFLGVGAVSRLRPVIYLIRSGYLDKFERISFDSSSHSRNYDHGSFVTGEAGLENLTSRRTPAAEKRFTDIYTFFEPCLGSYVTLADWLDMIFKSDGTWNFGECKKRALKVSEDHFAVLMTAKVLYTYYQIWDFMWEVDKLYTHMNDKTYIGQLLDVKTEDEMNDWFQRCGGKLETKAIKRRSDLTPTVDTFL